MISPTALAPPLAEYLPRQRWFGAKDRTIELVRIRQMELLAGEAAFPALLRVDAEVALAGTDDCSRYQLFLGLRRSGTDVGFLTGSEAAVLGEFETPLGPALVYDALLDGELALALLGLAAPGYGAERVRPLGAEQSNTSLVYDDAMILKVFRRLTEGRNPEVEVALALAGQGFTSIPEPLAAWRKDGVDLAILVRFLPGATDGWNTALASLRELFADGTSPAEARGDFAPDAERIGEMTAGLHQALARGFPVERGSGGDWAAPMEELAGRVLAGDDADLAEGARRIIARLRDLGDPGPALRVHGDYHLGQVLRTDAGWFTLDFEGEPARPLAQRTRPSSALRDVAGMLRSFSYAAAVALAHQDDGFPSGTPRAPGLDAARAWESRNRECFLAGYFRTAARGTQILPADPAVRSAVLAAFELDKALYEVAYERANRPEWAHIPLGALRRITAEAARTP